MLQGFPVRNGDPTETCTTSPWGRSDVREVNGSSSHSTVTVPVTAPPSQSIQAPSSYSLSVQFPPVISSFGKNSTQSEAPPATQVDYDHVAYDELRDFARPKGYARNHSMRSIGNEKLMRGAPWIPRTVSFVNGTVLEWMRRGAQTSSSRIRGGDVVKVISTRPLPRRSMPNDGILV